ncbi:putative phage abortive infection protein [Neisseria subflava]|jgi:putative transcriptional regulator|uniref:putative phage abortive infection protein n=1 Tax=Neisseria subflava TaxID=28449 RepID=UPI001F3A0C63|nr:putative phage abortive infection protein [Neisseria subflava]
MRCFTNFFSKKCICSVLVILGVLVGIDIYYKLDLVGWFTAIWTMFSAFGLIYFSFLTYKNQQSNEFYSLFKLILDENNRLLKEIIESKKNEVLILNKNIIDLFKQSEYISSEIEKDFEKKCSEKIDSYYEFKPYLITLFRLLKIISTSSKISNNDKKEYYGLIRGLTPPYIQFLILFNSLGYREKEKEKNYTDLLIESKFFEHLPITESWLTDVYLFDQEVERENRNPLKEEEKNLTSLLEEYIFSGKVIDTDAFGRSIYLEKHLFKASKL